MPTLIDLFCGAGGLSLGLQRAGFSPVFACDNWGPAIETYRRNFTDHIVHAAVHEDMELPEASVIVGGPPCQGFSSAGTRKAGDERNSLIGVFARIVTRLRPSAFVFENVEGFLTSGGGRFVLDLLEPLVCAGYRIRLKKINAANYGVPQHRKRVVAIGGLGWDPTFPPPTRSAHGSPGAHLAGHRLPSAPFLRDALRGLPPASTVGGMDNGGVTDHTYSRLRGEDLGRAKLLKPGQRMRDLPEHLWHPSYRRRAYRRVMDGTPSERRGGAPAGVRRLKGNEPCKAITSGALHEFLHPDEDRPLTIRECARVQTFPDDFQFRGSKAQKIRLIGNAVPPLLAERIGQVLLADLERAKPKIRGGALLTFTPTLSSGLSPALRAVCDLVARDFSPAEGIECGRLLWD